MRSIMEVVMSNSPLIDYTKISPNKTSPRNHSIDTITIHCVVGQVSVERLGEIFTPTSKQASSNYGIGYDGKIGMYVEEKDRSWCSSSASNDNRAITIECASDTTAPYRVNEVVYNKLIILLVDICRRNGKNKLIWFGDKTKSLNYQPANNEMIMTVHRWFAAKSCPGDYLFNLHSRIANEVNHILIGEDSELISTTTIIKHTVARGEILSKIAARYGTTVIDICLVNPDITNPNKIYTGQVLNIPVKLNDMPSTYTVVAGDGLRKIAAKVGHGCTWQELAEINGISAPYLIFKGQVIKLPKL